MRRCRILWDEICNDDISAVLSATDLRSFCYPSSLELDRFKISCENIGVKKLKSFLIFLQECYLDGSSFGLFSYSKLFSKLENFEIFLRKFCFFLEKISTICFCPFGARELKFCMNMQMAQ
jgi:hypothetical protein